MLLHNYLHEAVSRAPDRPALVAGTERVTYCELDERVRRLAVGLAGCGVRRSDRVAIYLDNGIDAVVAAYAVLRLGAVFLPVNPLTRPQKLRYLLNDVRACALVTQPALLDDAAVAVAESPSVATVVVAGELPSTGADQRFVAWAGIAREGGLDDPGTIDADLASIIYTSGSTGEPKGVMLTHLNMVTAATSVAGYLGLRGEDVIFCALPLAFDYGLYQVLMAAKVAATVVLEKSFAFPVRALEVMARERVTVFAGVPTMFVMLTGLASLPSYDLSSLRLITNTAAALPERRIAELRSLFPGAALYSMYGLTECHRVTYLPPEQLDARPTSVGRGMPNTEVWLVDEAGGRLPNGHQGELVIRGNHVMRGYWEKPAATAERLKPGTCPGETVLYSGDIFRTDSEGYLYFVARRDDIIKSRGEKVSPREVENVIHALAGVADAAVVGVPDAVLGEAVKAFIVLREGFAYSEREVIRHCLGHLESFMAPKFVEFVAELPKTETGKVRRAALQGASPADLTERA
jgi:long-chain acyl-CoA synthetase